MDFRWTRSNQRFTVIHLHMDNYVSSVLSEYKDFIRKTLRPKALPVAPNLSSSRKMQPRDAWLPRIHLDRISDHL